jgi:ubiquinone/menaquinone biosynthesis C-methylase UbiE
MKKLDKFGHCLEEYTSNKNNAQVYYNRAIGKSPEMEVSKALAKIVKKITKKNYRILDVGCACGHYYKSLKREIKNNFYYTGIDPYKIFLDKAKAAWKNEKNVNFKKGNIFDLPLDNREFDIVVCNNVLLHLPSIEKPLRELIRVSKKTVILRTVVYDVSYKIQLVYNSKWWKGTNIKPVNEFDKMGNPNSFSYFNIHSFDYLKGLVGKIDKKLKIKFVKDNFFSKKNIQSSIKKEKRPLATRVVGDEQFSGCLMQPHYFVIINKQK